MAIFRDSLRLGGGADVRSSVLVDLGTYYGLAPEECVDRCVNWESWSVEEWHAGGRRSADEIRDFYQTVRSWAFDLCWYAYLQAEGYTYPVTAALAQTLPAPAAGARHLDFGSGIGVASQTFVGLGWESDLADVSPTLLDFARFRLGRRGCEAGYIDLNREGLQRDAYGVITAVDTLMLVPDLAYTVGMLHDALKPGGYLFTNFDVRPPTPENAWHLYDDDLPLRWTLQRAGFEPEESLDGMITRYRKVEPSGIGHALRGGRDAVMLRSPLRPLYRRARALARRTLSASNIGGH